MTREYAKKNMGLRYGFASKMSGSKWWWFESWSLKWRCRMAISCRWAIFWMQNWHLYVVDGFVYVEETKCWIYFGEKSSSNEGGTGDEWLVDKMAAKRENSSPKVIDEGNWNGSDILYFLATKRRDGAWNRYCFGIIRNVAWGGCSLVEKYVKTMSVHTDWRKVAKNGVRPDVSSINHPLGVPSVTFPRCDVVGTMVERLNLNLWCLNFAKYGPKAVLIGKIFRCIWTGGITSAVWSCRKLADCNYFCVVMVWFFVGVLVNVFESCICVSPR